MNAHTSGPWRVAHADAFEVKTDDGLPIAQLWRRGDGKHAANALLIAAAPALLEACQQAAHWLRTEAEGNPAMTPPTEILRALEAAIATAGGEA